jgi:hypothetical protein
MKILVLCLISLLACAAQAPDSKSRTTIDPDEAYKNNCTRCHATVQSYSPRMNKTILLHMRVRANLSADVAQAILEYLNEVSSTSNNKLARSGPHADAKPQPGGGK